MPGLERVYHHPAEGRPLAKLENPYEAAFAAWLRSLTIPAIAIDEHQRQLLGTATVKNLDFIVTTRVPETAQGTTWLIDVKGRRFPSGRQRHYWKNWTTREDLRGLAGWEQQFGPGSSGLIVFAYLVLNERSPLPSEELFCFQDQYYAFLAIRWFEYASAARVISPKWETLAVPTRRFRELVRPARHFLQPGWDASTNTFAQDAPRCSVPSFTAGHVVSSVALS
jgi:hypothetical protein